MMPWSRRTTWNCRWLQNQMAIFMLQQERRSNKKISPVRHLFKKKKQLHNISCHDSVTLYLLCCRDNNGFHIPWGHQWILNWEVICVIREMHAVLMISSFQWCCCLCWLMFLVHSKDDLFGKKRENTKRQLMDTPSGFITIIMQPSRVVLLLHNKYVIQSSKRPKIFNRTAWKC